MSSVPAPQLPLLNCGPSASAGEASRQPSHGSQSVSQSVISRSRPAPAYGEGLYTFARAECAIGFTAPYRVTPGCHPSTFPDTPRPLAPDPRSRFCLFPESCACLRPQHSATCRYGQREPLSFLVSFDRSSVPKKAGLPNAASRDLGRLTLEFIQANNGNGRPYKRRDQAPSCAPRSA